MSIIKFFMVIAVLFIGTIFAYAQPIQDSVVCNIETLKITAEKIDRLTTQDIKKFLSSFDPNCKNNVEYSEWSNELLFDVLKKYPEGTLALIAGAPKEKQIFILSELEDPINDTIDIKVIMGKVKAVGVS